MITAYLSYRAQVPPDQVALRALMGGIGGYLLAWMCSVTVWRHLVLAELRAAIESGQVTMEPAAANRPATPAAPAAPAAANAANAPDGNAN